MRSTPSQGRIPSRNSIIGAAGGFLGRLQQEDNLINDALVVRIQDCRRAKQDGACTS